MTPEQLDRFQAWLTAEAEQSDASAASTEYHVHTYFNARSTALRDAFEYLVILRSQPQPETKNDDRKN